MQKMPGNKKPRHKRKVKGSTCFLFIRQSDIDELKALLTNTELVVEMKLPTGQCTFADVALMRDVLNFCSWASLYKAQIAKDINPEWVEANREAFTKAQNAFTTFYARGNDKGGISDNTVRYVATGEELCALRDGIQIAADFWHQMLDETPIHVVKLFRAMKFFLEGKGAGRLEFADDHLVEVMRKIWR